MTQFCRSGSPARLLARTVHSRIREVVGIGEAVVLPVDEVVDVEEPAGAAVATAAVAVLDQGPQGGVGAAASSSVGGARANRGCSRPTGGSSSTPV